MLIDGCHSMASAKNLYNYLKTLKEPIYGVWGMQKNKLPDQFIESFNKIFKKLITITISSEPNALNADELAKIGNKYVSTRTATSIQNALKKISSHEDKTIVVFGSLYLVGEVLSKN